MPQILLVSLIVLLVGAAILGTYPRRVGQSAQEGVERSGSVIPLGDRVAAGLFASTLMVCYGYVEFTGIAALIGVAASLPLAYYSFRLARELPNAEFVEDIRTWLLVIYALNSLIAIGIAVVSLCSWIDGQNECPSWGLTG